MNPPEWVTILLTVGRDGRLWIAPLGTPPPPEGGKGWGLPRPDTAMTEMFKTIYGDR